LTVTNDSGNSPDGNFSSTFEVVGLSPRATSYNNFGEIMEDGLSSMFTGTRFSSDEYTTAEGWLAPFIIIGIQYYNQNDFFAYSAGLVDIMAGFNVTINSDTIAAI
jgi:hypothetical protein